MTSQSDPLVEIVGLTVRHGSETLLSNVSLPVARGTLHAVVGPNGAGKTTLLSAILGQIPFTGRIAVHWIQSGRIGYVPQAFHVDRTLPVTVSHDFAQLRRLADRVTVLDRRIVMEGSAAEALSDPSAAGQVFGARERTVHA